MPELLPHLLRDSPDQPLANKQTNEMVDRGPIDLSRAMSLPHPTMNQMAMREGLDPTMLKAKAGCAEPLRLGVH